MSDEDMETNASVDMDVSSSVDMDANSSVDMDANSSVKMETKSSVASGPQMSLRLLVAPYTGKKQISVLILTPRWKYDRYGKYSITRSFIQNLRDIDPEGILVKITCAVLEEEGRIQRIREAENLRVQLKGYIHPRSTWSRRTKKEADLSWLNEDVVKYYNHVIFEMKYDFIIGHAPYFADGCFNLRDSCKDRDRGHTPKVILIAHELPQHENGETNKPLLREWLSEADVVYSMEKSTRDEITVQMREIEEGQVPQHNPYIPGYPTELFKIKREESASKRETKIMMITPMKKEELKGFNFPLAVNAVSRAHVKSRSTLTMLIEDKSDKKEWKREYRSVLKSANERLTFKCKSIKDDDTLKRQLQKSDLFLFPLEESSSLFGVEALSAIASGVPVLVSGDSGVGSFLLEMNENDSVVQQMSEKSWTKKIIQKINDPVTSQGKVKDLREHLLLDTTIASIHRDFVKMICDAGCAEIEIKLTTEEIMTETAIEIGKNIGLNDTDMCNPESYLTAFFEKIFLLREKLENGLLEDYIGKPLQQKWQKLFSSLEDRKRKLVDIKKGSIIFTLFCPTKDSFQAITHNTWFRKIYEEIAELLEILGFPKPQYKEVNSPPQEGDCEGEVSALLLTTRWLFDFTSITTVTRSLVNNLRNHDPNGENVKITCAILEKDGRIEKVQIDDAKLHNVTLRGAVQPMGDKMVISEFEKMNAFIATYYHRVFDQNSYNFIIGHAPLISFGAVNLKDAYKGNPIPKVVLVIHELPKTKQGLERETLDKWIRGTDIVFSIGDSAKNELERFLFGRKHELYIPIYTLEDSRKHKNSTIDSFEYEHRKQITLMVGREEFGFNGIDLKLAINAARSAAENILERQNVSKGIRLVLIGENAADEESLKMYLTNTMENEDILTFDFITSQSTQNMSAIIKKSVFLLPLKNNCSKFGLEALSAAAAGVPILVSENSGMAALLEEIGENEHSVVKRQRDFDLDVKAWKEKIMEKFGNYQKVKLEKERIRGALLNNRRIARTHFNFISTIVPTKSIGSVEKFVKAKTTRKRKKQEWNKADIGLGDGKMKNEDLLRTARFREMKRHASDCTRSHSVRKVQKMGTKDNGSQQNISEVTDGRLFKLSSAITEPSDLRKLGVIGLGLPTDDIEVHIKNGQGDICTAAYNTLRQWLASQSSRTAAYKNLCTALITAKMPLKIDEALR